LSGDTNLLTNNGFILGIALLLALLGSVCGFNNLEGDLLTSSLIIFKAVLFFV
jgi:hypothetical protein